MLELLVRGPLVLVSTGSVGPVEPANAELAATPSKPANVKAVSFLVIMM
jgi:hypothetical protein